jgi:hypothetical protein
LALPSVKFRALFEAWDALIGRYIVENKILETRLEIRQNLSNGHRRAVEITTHERLERVLRDLDSITSDLEERGFEAQSDPLDAAAEKVEDVAAKFESL